MRNERAENSGVIGPTPEEIEYFKPLPDADKVLRDDLVVVRKESRLGRFLNGIFGRLPKRAILPLAPLIAAIAFTGCPIEPDGGSQENPNPLHSPLETPGISNPEIDHSIDLLDLPFPPDPNMRIQQAWTGPNPTHHALDIIKGKLNDSSTWETFPVLAAADGKACANPEDKQGEAVMIQHMVREITIYTYYGHLQSIKEGMPDCGGIPEEVKRGDFIGMAGATGVLDEDKNPQPEWIHVHFRIFDENDISIDGFDISGPREYYPNINDPRFTDGKLCGSKNLIIGCPTEGKASPLETPFDPGWIEYSTYKKYYYIEYPSNIFSPPESEDFEGFDYDKFDNKKSSDTNDLFKVGRVHLDRPIDDFDSYVNLEVNNLKAGDANVSVVSETKVWDYFPAKTIEGWIGPSKEYRIKEFIVYVRVDGVIFNLSYVGKDESLDEYIDQMFASFLPITSVY
ncbi:MAG: hypothetical protein A2958_02005 [Candidatus Levybacteria bacterium RIFCSPLOWO2_01_FULL_38_13]|nr:MAG: hypothetical protein A2629_02760 [Candidatus Levybacteria bacterium RIFCSPHIGHO2_01_FULL_41_15]OGH35726.1 MAG: hypothetical protein A2958_02005 [Candidatus Levybacteria bacterium RIFCSPLOWO2_01_FULL_38_13]